jgi:hypothetical protein
VLVNVPAPDPTVTLNVDEPVVVPYTKPLALTCVAPSSVMLPPSVAEFAVILVAVVVASKAGLLEDVDKVVKLCAAP